MNKKLIALAVAAVMAPAAAMADSGNVTIYGKMEASYDNISTGAAGQDTLSRISSNSSQLGFKGSEDLGNGLSAIWQIENQINVDSNGSATSAASANGAAGTRNTFVGLSSKTMGTFILGTHDTPYKLGTLSLNVFGDSMGNYTSIVGSANGTNVRDLRLGNVAAYISPTFNGFHGAIATSQLNEAGNSGLSNPSAWSATGVYDNGQLFASLSYEIQKYADAAATALSVQCLSAGGTISLIQTVAGCGAIGGTVLAGSNAAAATDSYDTKGTKLGLGWDFKQGTKVGFVYEKLNDSRTSQAGTRNAYVLNVAHTMGNNVIKAQYGKANDGETALDTSAKNWTIGVDHNLSKRTSIYALYTKTDNAEGATYGVGGTKTTGAYTPAVGEDPRAVSLGVKHSF
ncbi:MAG: porin [Betaproteobacteria bacterium]|nr:porin [Betaproteobacteria bacterium]